ncbi:InlB B-repeat-containing protein [Candidatus Methanarcanum hacksteinii]|uniref:InlB B-repeat-containing protein n=1 Tax=Candidatus Methanarcanum hacksteinii TaxID=2911857 RepID=UPI0037DC1E9C
MSSKTLTIIALLAIIGISTGAIVAILAQDDADTYGNTYTITYELNGGIADPNSPSTYVSGTVTDLGCPTNENKDVAFFGWYLDKGMYEESVVHPIEDERQSHTVCIMG